MTRRLVPIVTIVNRDTEIKCYTTVGKTVGEALAEYANRLDTKRYDYITLNISVTEGWIDD